MLNRKTFKSEFLFFQNKEEENYKLINKISWIFTTNLLILIFLLILSLFSIIIYLISLTSESNSFFTFDGAINIIRAKNAFLALFGFFNILTLPLFIFGKKYLDRTLEKSNIPYIKKEIFKINYRIRYKKIFYFYTSLLIAFSIFIFTWPLSPSNVTNKETIDKEIINSLKIKKLEAERTLKEEDAVRLMSEYSDLPPKENYKYSVVVEPSFDDNSKYISSDFVRISYDSLDPKEGREDALKIRDYQYGKGITDNETYWKYRSDKLATGVVLYGKMQVIVPPLTCMSMDLLVSDYLRDYEIIQGGTAGFNIPLIPETALGDRFCNDKQSPDFHEFKIEKKINGNKNIQTEIKFSYSRRNKEGFEELPSPFKDRGLNGTKDVNLFPTFSKINIFLDTKYAIRKPIPNFCIQGNNLGYESNVWSIKSDSVEPFNHRCN